MKVFNFFLVTVLTVAFGIFAAPVAEKDALVAAKNFVGSDPVGSAIFGGKTVTGVRDADGLWIVSLAPAGHIILSGSDLVEPIVGFSPTDFADPDPESPAYVMLDGARAASLGAEASGTGTRNAKWAKLLEKKTRASLLAAPVESPGVIVVPPFLQSHYDQIQPCNDFCPIFDSSANLAGYHPGYRGRSPCGCIATSVAQIFRHFRWPVRIDRNFQYDHSFVGTNGIATTFPIRFDGHVPIDWNALYDSYEWYIGGYDLRGSVAESVRYPISRLTLWTDVMAQMSFGTNSSGASYSTVVPNITDWYTQGRWVYMQDEPELVKSDILAGVPCQISLGAYNQAGNRYKGHEVIAHGWAEDGTTQYAFINFGWGGSNDGYYNIAQDFQDYQEKRVYVGHYPRAKPQLEPLPKVCGPNVVLNWHFPDFYNNYLSGFTVAVTKFTTNPSTFYDNFSASDGVSTDSNIYVATDADGELLYSDYAAVGSYTYPKTFTLTSASVLTFRVNSYAAISSTLEVQAKFGDGEWQTISTPTLESEFYTPNWSSCRVYLGGHGGETVQFKIVRNWGGTYYIDNVGNRVDYGYVLLDDFQVTDVLEGVPTTYFVSATERNIVLPSLDSGASYSFAVMPDVSGALVDGEASDPILVDVAGNHQVPVPGEQTYHHETLSFSTSDASGVWSYSFDNNGSVVDGSSVHAPWDCSITATLSGTLTTASTLSFQWKTKNYYGNGSDTVSVAFTDASGNETIITNISNSANVSSLRNENLSLSSFAGQSGRIRVAYSHSGSAYVGSDYGGFLYSPVITNVQVPTVPAVAWDTVALTDLGTPSILSVSNVVNGVAAYPIREGGYRECRYGTVTEFDVECSEHVENLNAYSSHLALVGERQVTTRVLGPHTFRVSVDATGISEAQSRSRMILTLEAIDSNGTKAYKDLSLRFSEEGESPTVEPLEITTSNLPVATNGVPYSVPLEAAGGVQPYTWSAATLSEYDESRQASSFSVVGTPKGWQKDDECWELALPFAFPFYGSTYSTVWVNSNGTLTFDGYFTVLTPDSSVLSQHPMIAALWKDLDTRSGDIYVESSLEAVTIRWNGTYYNSTSVSFSATLYADGTIRLSYGAGNANGGMIGVSSGNYNNPEYILSSASGTSSMSNVLDIIFTPQTTLPPGLSISSVGVLSGTPTTAGNTNVTVFVTDSAGTRVGRTFNLVVEQPIEPLEITTNVLPPATNSMPYSVTLAATGGAGRYYWIAGDAYGYDSYSQSGSSFGGTAGTETAMGWQANLFSNAVSWKLDLPFEFPFYGEVYSNVWVSSLGTLTFDDYFDNSYASTNSLKARKMIAALWENIDTSSGNIYVKSSSDSVTIRWSGTYWSTSDPVSFAATLYTDGRVRLSYGAGNVKGGCIGVSSGNEPFCTLAAECSSESASISMNNANDIVFTPWSPVPEWLSLSIEEGVLSGTPTTPGTLSFHVYVMDVGGAVTTEVGKTLTLTVEAAATPLAPPVVSPGTNYVIACESNVTAADVAASMNEARATYIKAPEAVGLAGETAVAYANCFTARADGSNVVIEINEAGTNALETVSTNVAAQVAADLSTVAATDGAMTVPITGILPGFYYSVEYDDNLETLGSAAEGEGQRTLANADGSVTLQIPAKKPNATAGFYRVKVSVKAED